jgi:hypothetical protein
VEIKLMLFEAQAYAVRTQSLLSTLASGVQHMTRLIALIQDVLGNKQAQQVHIQLLATTNQTLMASGASQMATQRVEVLEVMSRRFVQEVETRIEADRWRGWPGWSGN